jgi:hypothetical protein
MPDRLLPFTDSDVHDALRNMGLIAWYRNLKGRIPLDVPGNPVPDLAPASVLGGQSTRIAMMPLEMAAMGSGIDGGAFNRPDAFAALGRIAGAATDISGLSMAAMSTGG